MYNKLHHKKACVIHARTTKMRYMVFALVNSCLKIMIDSEAIFLIASFRNPRRQVCLLRYTTTDVIVFI